jgi:hypothetical protein
MVGTKTQGQEVDHSIDRRASRRFQISLPVLFRWVDSVRHYEVGQCENIGSGGMFVLAKRCPPLGSEIDVEFNTPAFDLVPHSVRVRGVGRVCRIETCYHLTGFAIAGKFVNEVETKL